MGRSTTMVTTTTYPQLRIAGDTPALGATETYTTGIAKSNITAFSVIVSDSDGTWTLPNHGVAGTAEEYYYATIKADGNLYIYIPSTSAAVYGCAFSALITYTT